MKRSHWHHGCSPTVQAKRLRQVHNKSTVFAKAAAGVPDERLLRRGLCFPPFVSKDIGWWSQLQMFFQRSWKKFGRGDFPNVCEQAIESIPRRSGAIGTTAAALSMQNASGRFTTKAPVLVKETAGVRICNR